MKLLCTLLVFGYSLSTFASVLDIDNIKLRGPGCANLNAHIENLNSTKVLFIQFRNLKAELIDSQKESLINCDFAIPLSSTNEEFVRVSQPMIFGTADVPHHVNAKLNFEFAWPQHRGPNLEVGYKNPKTRITENVQATNDSTEVTFRCGEKTELVGFVSASVKAGWFYKNSTANIEATEVRLILEDLPCKQ
ncbi:MAG: hypothetical protein ACXVCY_03940 [Pseudobdellovibrionaceae bacterium]